MKNDDIATPPIHKIRINSLDALKCLGILLVIEGHILEYGIGIKVYDSLSRLMLYSFNMPIFFFVSGYLAYKDNMGVKKIGNKLWQKFLFLVIPVVIVRLFSDLLHGDNPLNVLHNGYGSYWFTITLFECFLIYYLVAMAIKCIGVQMIILAAFALLCIGLLSIYGKFGPALLDINRLTKYFQYFFFGLLAMRYKNIYERTMHNEWLKAICVLGFFALLFTINRPIWPASVFHMLRDLVLRYFGTFIVVSIFVCRGQIFDKDTCVNKVISFIGKKSLAIYLLHYFFIPHFEIRPDWMNGFDEMTCHIISFAYTIIITMVCLILISLLSNSKIIRKYVLGQKI